MIRGQLVKCGRGQSLLSLDTWAMRWGTTKKTVKRFFELLESDNMLEIENIQISTRISVLNYDNYQGEVNGQSTTGKRLVHDESTVAAPKQLMNNNEKNNKDINISFESFWDMYGKKMGSKKDAGKIWTRLTDTTRQTIIDSLPAYLASISEVKYLPYPLRYLREERWNNEITTASNSKVNPETGQRVTLQTSKRNLINPEMGSQR